MYIQIFSQFLIWKNGVSSLSSSLCSNFAQSDGWRLALGHMVGNVKGNEGKDDRRSPRRSWCGSTTQLQRDRRPPRRRQAAGVAAIVMGATTHGRSAALFHQILIGASEALSVTKIMLMDHPHRFLSGPTCGGARSLACPLVCVARRRPGGEYC